MDAFSSAAQHPAHKVPLWCRLIDASEAVNKDCGSQEADCSKGLNQAFVSLELNSLLILHFQAVHTFEGSDTIPNPLCLTPSPF